MRYLLFSGEQFYAVGGMNDLIGSYDSINDIECKIAEICDNEWWHVWDNEEQKIIFESEIKPYGYEYSNSY